MRIEVRIPQNTDLLYLGVSKAGMQKEKHCYEVYTSEVDNFSNLLRISASRLASLSGDTFVACLLALEADEPCDTELAKYSANKVIDLIKFKFI